MSGRAIPTSAPAARPRRAVARADVWVLKLDTLQPDEIARCDQVLSARERERMGRFRFAADRDAYRAAHALARIALSWREPAVPPHAWAFTETPQGKPEIDAAGGLPRLRFNLSHTRDVVACIVTRDLDCGVDVEATHRCSGFDDLSRAILAPAELAQIAAAPAAERTGLFCRLWTLKEACVKALGVGLSVPLDSVAFDLGEGSARLRVPSDEWHFAQWSPSPTHVVATAVRAREAVHLIRHEGLPRDPAVAK